MVQSSATHSANRRGAALMVGSMAAFTVNDAFMKALGESWPLLQSMFIRGLFAVVLMAALAALLGQFRHKIARQDWHLMWLRAFCEGFAALLFLSAVFNMPLADATAILQSLPLTVTLAGALFLGEAVGWRRWAAIAVGFIGVLFIVQPGGEGYSPYALSAMGAVVLITARDMVVRKMSAQVPSVLAALLGAIVVTILAGIGSIFETWEPLSPPAAIALIGAVVTILGAYILSVAATRAGDIGFVAPYRYSALLIAMIIGYLFFNEVPGPLTLIGAALITATGLYTLFRENRAIDGE